MERAYEAPDPAEIDQRVVLHDVSWAAYEALLAMRGESSALRVTYLEGELEIMAPSINHEDLKKRIGRLLEAWAWADEVDIPLEGAGSWTVKRKAKKRGAEPDECYFVGGATRKPRPDIAIEVVWTSGGISKLSVWQGLRVPEVWTWERGTLAFYGLGRTRYAKMRASKLLPGLPIELIERCMAAPSQTAAVKMLRSAMRRSRRKRR